MPDARPRSTRAARRYDSCFVRGVGAATARRAPAMSMEIETEAAIHRDPATGGLPRVAPTRRTSLTGDRGEPEATLAELAPQYLGAVEESLRRAVGSGPLSLRAYYEMLEYHLGWSDGAGGAASPHGSGKRVRPLLCLLSCAAAGGDWRHAVPMATAIELVHNFSLVHDDIEDKCPLRRGRPTLWARWGEAQAINAGDAMFVLAHLALQELTACGVPAAVALDELREFDRVCLVTIRGQHLDLSFEDRARVTVAEYLWMIEAKAGALIAATAYLGAKLAGADRRRASYFYRYGRSLGLSFQVRDDLLGIWGDPSVTGKSAASDLEKRKKSLPVVYGLERSEEFARAYAIPHQPGASVAGMAAALEAMGARRYAERKAATLTADAMRHLAAATASRHGRALRELTHALCRRET